MNQNSKALGLKRTAKHFFVDHCWVFSMNENLLHSTTTEPNKNTELKIFSKLLDVTEKIKINADAYKTLNFPPYETRAKEKKNHLPQI